MDSQYFAGILSDLSYACQSVQDEQMCGHCPLKPNCLEDMTFIEVCNDVPRQDFEELIKMGDSPFYYALSEDDKAEVRAWNNGDSWHKPDAIKNY